VLSARPFYDELRVVLLAIPHTRGGSSSRNGQRVMPGALTARYVALIVKDLCRTRRSSIDAVRRATPCAAVGSAFLWWGETEHDEVVPLVCP
jgi:hypothetical protein